MDIRVSHEEKRAFMHAVSEKGETASGVIRRAMAQFTDAASDRRGTIKKHLIAGGLVAVIAAASIGGWELASRGDFGAAYADGTPASFQLKLETETGTRHVLRANSRILLSPGESTSLSFDRVTAEQLQTLVNEDVILTGGFMTVHIEMIDIDEADRFMYRFRITVTDQDGMVYETPINPAISASMDQPSVIESSFGTSSRLMIDIMPLSIES
jgi:hypothetical protein